MLASPNLAAVSWRPLLFIMRGSGMRFSPFVERITGHGVAAWDIHHAAFDAQRNGEDVIILSVGDPDFPTPDFITDAAIEALRSGDTHYTDIAGRPSLRQAIASRYSDR